MREGKGEDRSGQRKERDEEKEAVIPERGKERGKGENKKKK